VHGAMRRGPDAASRCRAQRFGPCTGITRLQRYVRMAATPSALRRASSPCAPAGRLPQPRAQRDAPRAAILPPARRAPHRAARHRRRVVGACVASRMRRFSTRVGPRGARRRGADAPHRLRHAPCQRVGPPRQRLPVCLQARHVSGGAGAEGLRLRHRLLRAFALRRHAAQRQRAPPQRRRPAVKRRLGGGERRGARVISAGVVRSRRRRRQRRKPRQGRRRRRQEC
jgi:hypothetical protein